ncbi:MAG: tripartite tricarboxylate transporter substrate-binding protein, partial [Xanthobacteraceae bacterium]
MKLSRRKFLPLATGAVVGLVAVSRAAGADNYPSRPVRLVVGFPAGTSSDITARLIAQWLSTRLGQQVIVENRTGAGTNVAADSVVHASPDGNSLLWVTQTNAINATLYNNLDFDYSRDIEPVG